MSISIEEDKTVADFLVEAEQHLFRVKEELNNAIASIEIAKNEKEIEDFDITTCNAIQERLQIFYSKIEEYMEDVLAPIISSFHNKYGENK